MIIDARCHRIDPESKRPVPWTASFREQLTPYCRELVAE